MSIIAQNKGGNFEIVPAGNHVARCYSMIEIGTIIDPTYQIPRTIVRVTWELPNEKKVFKPENGEQPFSISKEYTLSMNEKATLRKDLESWRGKGFTDKEAEAFDISKLLTVPCMLNVIHKKSNQGNQYAVVQSITPIPKGMTCPPQINPTFELSYGQWDDKKFAGLPEWLKEKMTQTKEFKAIVEGTAPDVGDEPVKDEQGKFDDLPF